VLYFFQGGGDADGADPLGELIFDHAGNLYGTTSEGGSPTDGGTIFELSPPSQQGGVWSEAILCRFKGRVGAPHAGVVFGPNGALFGTTLYGETTGGAVFTLQPPSKPGGDWSLAVIYNAHTTITAGVTITNPHTLYTMSGGIDGNYISRYQIPVAP
jgi:uncharacterized repeat protein (TIGR03803 family)